MFVPHQGVIERYLAENWGHLIPSVEREVMSVGIALAISGQTDGAS
jgi:hypothetical protein